MKAICLPLKETATFKFPDFENQVKSAPLSKYFTKTQDHSGPSELAVYFFKFYFNNKSKTFTSLYLRKVQLSLVLLVSLMFASKKDGGAFMTNRKTDFQTSD